VSRSGVVGLFWIDAFDQRQEPVMSANITVTLFALAFEGGS
jgi:hypothetical protein